MQDSPLSYNRLRLDLQDIDAFYRIRSESILLETGVYWYDDDGIKKTNIDDYGVKLTYISSHTLAKHLSGVHLTGWDAAVLEFLNALPQDTMVVLWWS